MHNFSSRPSVVFFFYFYYFFLGSKLLNAMFNAIDSFFSVAGSMSDECLVSRKDQAIFVFGAIRIATKVFVSREGVGRQSEYLPPFCKKEM